MAGSAGANVSVKIENDDYVPQKSLVSNYDNQPIASSAVYYPEVSSSSRAEAPKRGLLLLIIDLFRQAFKKEQGDSGVRPTAV